MDEITQTGTPEFEALPERRGAQWIFIGEHGLRAGWSALIFVAIFIVLELLYGVTVGPFFRSRMDMHAPLGPGIAILQEIIQLILMLVATAIMAQIEKRKIVVYGYSGSARFSRFIYGLLWGIIAISVLIGILWKGHLLAFDGSPLSGFSVWKYAAAWAFFFLIVGLFEESLLRGYLQYTLSRGIGFWWAALLLSKAFALGRLGNGGESVLRIAEVCTAGLVFWLSLWTPDRCGGPSASMPDGTGANRIFMVPRTVAW